MGYVIGILLFLFSPTTYQASAADGVMCTEVAEVLDQYIADGGDIPLSRRDEIVDRCIELYS